MDDGRHSGCASAKGDEPVKAAQAGNRSFLVGLVFFILLIWGPIDRAWPLPMLIRIAYLVAVPVVASFVLALIWRRWNPDTATENRLTCVIAGAIAGALFVGAAIALQADHHFECDQEVRTRDGTECVGDYVLVPGPDRGGALLMVGIGAFAAWFGIKHDDAEPADDADDAEA